MSLTKNALEKKFNIILIKDIQIDSGSNFWIAHQNENGELGKFVADGYTLTEIASKL